MPVIAIDFDGVIHSYTSPWTKENAIPDGPVPGAFDFIRSLLDNGLDVCIFSTRTSREGATHAMREWLSSRGLEQIYIDRITFPSTKPSRAILFIDDRAYTFTGQNWPSVEFCREFKPWNKV